MDSEKKVQALPGAPQRPVQTQSVATALASGEVSARTHTHAHTCKFTTLHLFGLEF